MNAINIINVKVRKYAGTKYLVSDSAEIKEVDDIREVVFDGDDLCKDGQIEGEIVAVLLCKLCKLHTL